MNIEEIVASLRQTESRSKRKLLDEAADAIEELAKTSIFKRIPCEVDPRKEYVELDGIRLVCEEGQIVGWYRPGDGLVIDANAPAVDAVEVVRKPVVGYEGYYEVDQFGRVFSVERVISVDDNGRKYEKPVSGKQMKQCLKNNGYKSVSLTKGGATKAFYVHRLVAEAFIPNPDNLPMVNHKDEDKTNNFLENLEWCTAQYNNTYGNKAKRQANKIRGIAHSNEHKKKITSSLLKYYETHDSASIGRISEKRKGVVGVRNGESVQFQSVKDAAIAVNGSRANITRSCNSKTRKAYGYKWTWVGERKEGDD